MSRGPLTVFHTSDFQCGKPFVPMAAEAMLRLAAEIEPDVVVSSGDLTQRAKSREFATARAILDRFGDVPAIVTPGNHDIPLYRFVERLLMPYRRWKKFAGPDLDTVTRVPGATFVALNSSTPLKAIVNGRLSGRQLDYAKEAFEASAIDHFRILVTHHHFVPVPDGAGGHILPRASQMADAFEEMDLDAVLGGHVHQLHFRTTADVLRAGVGDPAASRRGVPLIAAGTATSRRGRGPEALWNSLCVLRFSPGTLSVTPYRREPHAEDFEAAEEQTFQIADRSMDRERVG